MLDPTSEDRSPREDRGATGSRPPLGRGELQRPIRAIDPARLRLARETELHQAIAKDRELVVRLEHLAPELEEQRWAHRRHHLASSVRITPRISPKLAGRFECVREILGRDLRAELYVEHSAEIGAACTAMPDGSLVVAITSGAVEKLGPAEQLFVMGHEVGHFLLGHHDWPVAAILAPHGADEETISPRLALQLLAWSRCCELSADRFGMLCAQSEEAMAQSFLKLASGLSHDLLGSGEDYLAQLEEWKQDRGATDGWASTHPLHAIRIRAGQAFWRSEHVDALFGPCPESPAIFTAEQADDAALCELSAMDPDPATLRGIAHGELVRRFVAWAGVAVVSIDGHLDPRELPVLAELADDEEIGRAMAVLSEEGIQSLCRDVGDLASGLVDHVSEDVRKRALVHLIVLAWVDGRMARDERDLIHLCAGWLDLPVLTADRLISRLESGDWDE